MKWHIDPSKIIITDKVVYIREYYENGQLWFERYYLNNKRHNPNGPAYREWYENGQLWFERYYLNNKRHNPNGPAYRGWHKDGELNYEEYHLNGRLLSKEEHAKLTQHV